jgi:hypothetical protein
MNILLRYTHGNKRTKTHDAVCDNFVAISWNVYFHVGRKQLHMFFSTTLNSSHQRVDIMFTKDEIRTLLTLL